VTPKLGEWLQQIPGTSVISAQKSAVLGTAKILHSTLKHTGRGPKLEGRVLPTRRTSAEFFLFFTAVGTAASKSLNQKNLRLMK